MIYALDFQFVAIIPSLAASQLTLFSLINAQKVLSIPGVQCANNMIIVC